MSLEENKLMVSEMEQTNADANQSANLQKAISLLHPFLIKLIHSKPIPSKKMGNKKLDFSKSLQIIISDWKVFHTTKSKYSDYKKHFKRAMRIRNLVAHQSLDCYRYQHDMECLSKVAIAIGKPHLVEVILKLVAIEEGEKQHFTKEETSKVGVTKLKEYEWTSLKDKGNQFYKEENWTEAMNYFTRAIHLNQEEATLYHIRAQCELRLSKFDLAREDIEDAIQFDPKNVEYFRILSDVLVQLKLHKESLAACLQGLEIDPRDEVLNIRERDCRALLVSDETDKHPVFGKAILKASSKEKEEKFAKMVKNIEKLHLTTEDIEDFPSLESFLESSKLCTSTEKAHRYIYGKLSATQDGQKKALEIFAAAAEKGIADGLYNLARFYSEGKAGLPKDFPKAMELCRKAASQKSFYRFQETIVPNVGVAEAEAFLGDCYRDGRGVDRCTTEAFKWLLRGARHNCPAAQNNLGLALLNGDGCKQDETSARSWFQKAAEHGASEAQYNYAMMLEEGRGGPIGAKKAGKLLKLSANQGNAEALKRLQNLSMSGVLGASFMERTKENLVKAAKKVDSASQFLLGENYMNGTGGFEKDLAQAFWYLRKASKAGYAEAHLPLGKVCLEMEANELALKSFEMAAEGGSAEGQLHLGLLFAYGHGCDRDEAIARRWLNRAKNQGGLLGKRSSDNWIEETIDFGRKMCEFETQQQLKSQFTLIQERKKRFAYSMLDAKDPATSNLLEFLDALYPPSGLPLHTPNIRSMKNITDDNRLNELIFRSENGSATAQSFFRACEILQHATVLLKQQQTNDAFKLYRLSQREWDLPIVEFSDFYSECLKAAKQALDRNSQDADALYALARIDMTQSNMEKLRMVKRCVELDPSVPDFHELLSCMLGFVGDHKNGLRAVERAIELLPNHPDWLYGWAGFIRLGEKDKFSAVSVEAYLKLLSSIPMDHRKYPDACYYLAHIYLVLNENAKGKAYYQKGLEAEDPGIRLPCFQPVNDNFPPKLMTRMLLQSREGMNTPIVKKTAGPAAVEGLRKTTVPSTLTAAVAAVAVQKEKVMPREETDCANCLKSNQSFRCIACKSVWYCDRTCQVAHWKKHKVDCKLLNEIRVMDDALDRISSH